MRCIAAACDRTASSRPSGPSSPGRARYLIVPCKDRLACRGAGASDRTRLAWRRRPAWPGLDSLRRILRFTRRTSLSRTHDRSCTATARGAAVWSEYRDCGATSDVDLVDSEDGLCGMRRGLSRTNRRAPHSLRSQLGLIRTHLGWGARQSTTPCSVASWCMGTSCAAIGIAPSGGSTNAANATPMRTQSSRVRSGASARS